MKYLKYISFLESFIDIYKSKSHQNERYGINSVTIF